MTALLGEGGMGQVYRATDTNLKRQVAIKVLLPEVAGNPERLARFRREAQTLAALNHPNIAHIHGLEEGQEGREGQVGPFLVMELVDGEELAARIARGPMPLDEALPLAKQIAEALEAAHEQGIIHRDLKPANIKVRSDGTVKVLDFGLAKALDRSGESGGSGRPGGHDLSASPTLTSPAYLRQGYGGQVMTEVGMILGTAAYMAPEQARGKAVDKRADIWAFGAVLYEMLTARRAFPGEDVTDTMVSVVSREPDWSALPAATTSALRRLLARCLKKEPKARMRDIGEARLQIEELLSGAVEEFPTPLPAPAASSSHRTARTSWLGIGAAALVAAGLALPAVRHLRETPLSAPLEMRVELQTPATSDLLSFALSPDGRQVAFVASEAGVSRLWVRSLSGTVAQSLPGTDGAQYPFWSPDSRSIAYFQDGRLTRMDLAGGRPQVLATATPRGGAWNADGVILFTPNTGSPLYRVSASGGLPVPAMTLKGSASDQRVPAFLPDGRHFLFLEAGPVASAGIYLGSLDSSDATRLTPADRGGAYLPSGWLLWVDSGRLVARKLDVSQRALIGDQITIAGSVASDTTSLTSAVSVSPTGLIAYRAGVGERRQLAWFDRSGAALGTMGAPDENGMSTPRLSPDGRRVSMFRIVQGNADIWMLDSARLSRFTFDPALDRFGQWSPDGKSLVFDSNRAGRRDLYLLSSANAGSEQLLLDAPGEKSANDWSHDGRFILYRTLDPQTAQDLWVLPMQGDRKPWVFLKTRFDERVGQFSPDDRWVTYMSNESGRLEVYVRPFIEPTASSNGESRSRGQWQISTGGGIFPKWSADGRELYYIAPDGRLMAAPINTAGGRLEPGAPVALFTPHIYGGGLDNQQNRQYDVSRDGRFLVNTELTEDATPITLLINWNPDPKK